MEADCCTRTQVEQDNFQQDNFRNRVTPLGIVPWELTEGMTMSDYPGPASGPDSAPLPPPPNYGAPAPPPPNYGAAPPPPPPPGYAAPPPAPPNYGAAPQAPPSYGYATRGKVGRPTSPGKQILLTIVTLGIWAIVWTYRQHEDIKQYSGDGVGGVLGLVIYLVISPVTFFLLANEVQTKLYEREGQQSPVKTIDGLWILLPLIGNFVWYFKVQNALNDFWIARGAPAP
jgi:hypothetical protein